MPDQLAAPTTTGAGLANGKETLLIENFAAAMARCTGNQSAIRVGTRSLALCTRLHAGNEQVGRQAPSWNLRS